MTKFNFERHLDVKSIIFTDEDNVNIECLIDFIHKDSRIKKISLMRKHWDKLKKEDKHRNFRGRGVIIPRYFDAFSDYSSVEVTYNYDNIEEIIYED